MVSLSKKKVCVVGAGLSGLASARELLREGHDVTVMEQSGGVGGQWLYDPTPDAGDPLGVAGVHSSMYASVRLLSPREMTCFSDFPFFPSADGTGDARRYPGHAEFLRYMRDFCDAFGLTDVVRLNTKVIHVGLAADDGDGTKRWTVRSSSRRGDRGADAVTTEEEVFDAVVVAVGQYTQPRLPIIDGMDRWRRRQLHSHSYRTPDSFAGEVVVVVGFQASGKEIAQELCAVAREVHVSVKSMDGLTPPVRHPNLQLHLEIERLCEDGRVIFAGDGCAVVADSIVYCTGYDVSLQFLDTGGVVTVAGGSRFGPLFEHTFPPALAPSLSFVGMLRLVMVPRFFEAQGRWVAQVLSGRRRLPSPEEMARAAAAEEDEAASSPASGRRLELNYCDVFGAKHCDFPPVEAWKLELLSAAFARVRDGEADTYRDSHRDSELVREGLRSEGWLP